MKKIIFIFLFLIQLFSLRLEAHFCPWGRDTDSLVNYYIKQLKKEGYRVVGIGGMGIGKLKGVSLEFDYDSQIKDINVARKQFIEKADYLILLMNANEKLKPYYADYPCSIHNIELDITYVSKKGEWYRAPNIISVANRGDRITYLEMNKDPLATPRFNVIHTETYEEAKKILLSETNSP